jgi:hypothetical protein
MLSIADASEYNDAAGIIRIDKALAGGGTGVINEDYPDIDDANELIAFDLSLGRKR